MPAVNTFAGGRLDRGGPRRTDDRWVAERRADPASRAVLATSEGVLVRDGATPALVGLGELPAGIELVLLGIDRDGAAVFAADPGAERAAALAPGAALRGLRDVAAEAAPPDAGLLAHATGVLNWHRRHRFCANCGAPTAIAEAGHVRACPRCGAQHHPRTDPVVITLVHDDDRRVLLGRQPTWPAGRYSALAGFVEPGESLEEAVVREVGEEAGVAVTAVRYRSSQPWPFPASLMLGFEAAYAGGDAHPHDHELEDVRWVPRAELARAVAGEGPLLLPPPLAIARRLIEGWLERTA
ncbi:MAG TPA: NAD(+) diphosphatase [Solirubrobacteraceae bacterium]|nr:NAD(+) diphosphatase [Solirubrobacteraceae bacterium]